jgi:hypothetical protein
MTMAQGRMKVPEQGATQMEKGPIASTAHGALQSPAEPGYRGPV